MFTYFHANKHILPYGYMNKRLKENEYYKTSELQLVALLSMSFPIEAIDFINGKAIFYFKNSPELISLIEKFWRKEATAEISQYFSQLKYIKSRIYEKKSS